MSKVKVLFFAADPFSTPPDGDSPRLLLDEDVRQIQQKVRAAEHRHALEFDWRLAARTDDLLQALNETRPQVVHFSGHGDNEGLVLVSSDGRSPHWVDAAALAQLFQIFRDDIQVVVLNACFSLPQAQAIAGAVGCAIGTSGETSDEAAITFGGSFYRAIAFGHSVQAAFDQARAALALEHFDERECPQLVVRPGVDPTDLVLIPAAADGAVRGDGPIQRDDAGPRGPSSSATPSAPPSGRRVPRAGMMVAGLMFAGVVVATSVILSDRPHLSQARQPIDSMRVDAPRPRVDTVRVPDSALATVPAREPVPRATAKRRQTVVAQSADTGEQPVVTARRDTSAPVFNKLPDPPDPFATLDGSLRDRTIPPAYPR